MMFFLSGAISLQAQITPRNILQKLDSGKIKEAILAQKNWTPLPKTPDGWKDLLPDSSAKKIIHAGEEALKFEFKSLPATLTLEFVRDGNRTRYEKASFEKRNKLFDLALAESVEGKGRFTDAIANGVWSVCEESYWGITAHIGMQKAGSGLPDVSDPTVDLFTAETAAVLAWTDYFAGDELEKVSKLIRPRIYTEVNRRVFVPLLTAKYGYLGGGNSQEKLNNWAPWVMSNYLNALFLLEKDGAKTAQGTQMAIRYIDQYINGLGDDGGCDEGPSYWTAAGACVFDALNLLDDFTGGKVNVYHQPIIRNMGAYIYKTHIAGKYFINVADAAPQLVPDGYMIFRFGQAMDDKQMTGFGSWIVHTYPEGKKSYEQFHKMRTLFDLKAIKTASAYPPKQAEVTNVWFNDVQLMAARSADGFFVSIHGGNNGESHNHNDVGDFTVYYKGAPVIIDAGAGTYTAKTFSAKSRYTLWFNTSPFHNLPTINGMEQGSTGKFKAESVKYNATANGTTFTANIAPAYPENTGVKSWIRTVSIGKKTGLKVTDDWKLISSPKNLTQSFMTVCKADASQTGKLIFTTEKGDKVMMDYDAKFWSAKMENVELNQPEDQKFKANWDNRPITRIILTAKNNPQNAQTTYRFYH